MQKTVSVNDPEVSARLVFGQPFALHCLAQSIRNTNSGGARTEHHDLLIFQTFPGHFHCAQSRSQSDRRSPLDVIIKGQQFIAIALKNRPRMRRREVFPLQARSGNFLLYWLNELTDEVEVRLTVNPVVPPTEVVRVL